MAKAEKIIVELSFRDRVLIKQLIDAVGIKPEHASVAEKTLKRLAESNKNPDDEAWKDEVRRLGGDYSVEILGEGDWTLNNEQKVGEDD